VFVRWFTSAEECADCGLRFERGPGHWIGGSEINLLVTYPFCVVVFAVPCLLFGGSWEMATAGGAMACVMALAVHRPARGLFFALDYLVEPNWDGGEGEARGGDGRDPHPDDPGPRAPGGVPVASVPVLELPLPVPAPRIDAEPHPELRPDSVRS
jgi:hypothetical protein